MRPTGRLRVTYTLDVHDDLLDDLGVRDDHDDVDVHDDLDVHDYLDDLGVRDDLEMV